MEGKGMGGGLSLLCSQGGEAELGRCSLLSAQVTCSDAPMINVTSYSDGNCSDVLGEGHTQKDCRPLSLGGLSIVGGIDCLGSLLAPCCLCAGC